MILSRALLNFIILSILSLPLHGYSRTIVISDIDDTIRMSHVGNCVSTAKRFLFGANPFPMMKEIFHGIRSEAESIGEEVSFHYVTASIRISYNPDGWVRRHDFPAGEAIQRSYFHEKSKKDFKIKHINRVLDEQQVGPDDKVLFFGDNTEYDVLVYQEVIEQRGLKNATIYIHDIKTTATDFGFAAPVSAGEGVRYFFSELDLLAMPEFQNLRIRYLPQTFRMAKEGRLIPKFVKENLRTRLENLYCSALRGSALDDCLKFAKTEAERLLEEYRLKFLP